MHQETTVPQTFSNQNASIYLGVSPDMLRLSRTRGFLFKGVPAPKFLKIGAAIRYRKEELDNWTSTHNESKIAFIRRLASIVLGNEIA